MAHANAIAGQDPALQLPAGFSALPLEIDGSASRKQSIVTSASSTDGGRCRLQRRSTVTSDLSSSETLVESEHIKQDVRRRSSVYLDKRMVEVSVNEISSNHATSDLPACPLDRIVNEEFDDFPIGPSRLAAFLNTADTFTMCRRYGRAHCRILLECQTQISKVIEKLDTCDNHILEFQRKGLDLTDLARNEAMDPVQKSLVMEMQKQREVLLNELKMRLIEFDDFVLKYNQVCSLSRPPDVAYAQVLYWTHDNKLPDTSQDDCTNGFISHRNDMVYVVDHIKQADGFDRVIEWCCSRWPSCLLQWCLRSRKDRKMDEEKNTDSEKVIFFSRAKILFFGKLIAILLSVAILLLPVFMLSLVDMERKVATSLVLVFVLAFAMMMSLFARAKAEGVFISTCAYCAVLVTFLGNVQSSGGSGA